MKVLTLIPLTAFFIRLSLAQPVAPILEFPQRGLDDPARYKDFTTRFYRDTDGNAIQILLNNATGRVVHVWADGANESIGFTVRNAEGAPAAVAWGGPRAGPGSNGRARLLSYELTIESPSVEIGWILLNSMRVERDFHYSGRDMLPFKDEPAFRLKEVGDLIDNLAQLPEKEQSRHLAALRCASVDELRGRLHPGGTVRKDSTFITWSIEQPTLDGRNRLGLSLRVDTLHCSLSASPEKLTLHSVDGSAIILHVQISTDSPSLTPLTRERIFNSKFLGYYQRVRRDAHTGDPQSMARFQWLDRQVRGLELLSYEEKLMAGLPNFATYFGRDMMMSALMMEEIWKPEMLGHVVGSVLRKLAPGGEVSHEEALGWQAIREHAATYSSLLTQYRTQASGADSLLEQAYAIIRDIQSVRENFVMVDDDFQLSVLAARYLGRTDVTAGAKKSFLNAAVREGEAMTRLGALLHNLAYITNLAHPYVVHRNSIHLAGFPRLDDQHWWPGSWRDSRDGYANGRFAMDINVIWVPNALEATETILSTLHSLGYANDALARQVPHDKGRRLLTYIQFRDSIAADVRVWRGSRKHFEVTLTDEEVRESVKNRIDWLPQNEREYWRRLVDSTQTIRATTFLALSLDENGRPIRVMNTDLFTRVFLEKSAASARSDILSLLNSLVRPYPVGVFVEGLGPLVANDTYASREVWETFRADRYHSPYVVWGREVNLLQLGLAKHVLASGKSDTSAAGLRQILRRTVAAVEASGLKHNELWSYRIEGGKVIPERYATTSDVQLWNLTDLAVQYMLDLLK